MFNQTMVWYKKLLKGVENVAEALVGEDTPTKFQKMSQSEKPRVRKDLPVNFKYGWGDPSDFASVAEDEQSGVLRQAPSFLKFGSKLGEAVVVNVKEKYSSGFRFVTGTEGRREFRPTEGPLVSSVSLQDLTQMSKSVYDDDGGNVHGYDTVKVKKVKDLQFVIYQSQNDGHVVVSFRGSANFDNWKDRNLKFHSVDDGHGNMVHEGFKSAWDDLKPAVDAELFDLFHSNEFGNNVTFTGHSLGGAISQIATADYMESQNPALIDTVTFASPTVGDQGFNDRIPGGHMMRIVDPRDSVPKVVQKLAPQFKPPRTATRKIALGGKDARVNDELKRDALRMGLDISFDIGIAMLLAYAPELGPEAFAAEEEAFAAAESSVLKGTAEMDVVEDVFLDAIGSEGEKLSLQELSDIRQLFNPEFRENISSTLRGMNSASLEENVVRIGDKIDWEKTIKISMAKAGVTDAAQNLITPFVMDNIEGEVSPEGVKFLLDNSFDYMWGAVRAHPMDTYVENVKNHFGANESNARADMWNNYMSNRDKFHMGLDEDLVEFMTRDELEQFKSEFKHEEKKEEKKKKEGGKDGKGGIVVGGELIDFGDDNEDEDEEAEEDDFEDGDGDGEAEDEHEELEDEPDTHNLGGIESNVVNGRPLEVFANRTGRKSDGSTIFSVRTESGEVLSYTGPSHSASTTTLFGAWTGIAPYANALPKKVTRTSGFGGRAFSALDSFSMAYLINSYADGYHNQQADDMYKKRIKAAIRNGYISDTVDHDENRVAHMILRQFEEKGHLFGAEDTSITERGNMLAELSVLSRGSMNDSVDNVNGVNVNFSRGEKRKLERAFQTSEGQAVAREVITRASNRLSSTEVTGTNVLENGMESVDFNMRVLRSLGLENSVEYDILDAGAKQAANAYKTALNVENELQEVIREKNVDVQGLFSNPLGTYVTRDNHRDEDINMSGNEEYLKDRLTLEIVKAIL